jgi:gallate decarboxylase subunit D
VRSVSIGNGAGRHRVEAVIVFCGPDISVSFGGGESPHIGAVALGVPRPSLADASKPSASASVLCVTGHKEDEIVRAAALELATVFTCRVIVAAGLHVDNATAEDIRLLDENYGAVLFEVKRRVSWERAERT